MNQSETPQLGAPQFRAHQFGLGCAQIGNHLRALTDGESVDLLTGALAAGVRAFDTAPHYGLGTSERRLGLALAQWQVPRDQLVISTKVGRLLVPQAAHGRLDTEDFVVPAEFVRQPDYSIEGVRVSLYQSLTRLGLDRVDVAYVHDAERYDLTGGLTTALTGLQRLRDEGVVGRIGFASMDPAALSQAIGTGGWDELMVAAAYTLASDDATLCDLAAAQGIDVVAAAVFNGGVLAAGLSLDTSAEQRFDYQPITPTQTQRVRQLMRLCAEFGVDLPAAALHFPLRHPAVIRVVAGGQTVAQVERNLTQLSAAIPAEFWAAALVKP